MSDKSSAGAGSNAEQIEFWDGASGSKWAAYQEQMDVMLGPLGEAALNQLAAQTGERVLDLGCGCGDTSLAMATRGANVTGVDVSGPMLAHARNRATAAGLDVEFLQADAADFPFAGDSYDAAFSRFGVMFFHDPAAAFTNIRKALLASGRLSFVCWQAVTRNPWITTPMSVLARHLPAQPAAEPFAPGPFAFADPARVESILQSAGFQQVAVTPFEADVLVGRSVPEAMLFLEQIGPAARLLGLLDDDQAQEVRSELETLLGSLSTANGINMGAACWLVDAR